MGVSCKIYKKLGTIKKSDKAEMKLQLISWNGNEPVYDLRIWLSDGKARSGVGFTKEELLRIVELYKGIDTSDDVVIEDEEEVVLTKPKKTTKATKTTKSTTKTKETTTTKKSASKKTGAFNVEEITDYDEEYEQAETDTNYTIADAKKKLDEIFKDETSKEYQEIKERLAEELEDNEQFIQNFMRESKTLGGAKMYMVQKAAKYGASTNHCVVFNDVSVVNMFIEYFDID